MKNKFAAILFASLIITSCVSAYYIESFHSDIHMFKDASYDVEERIEVNFGSEQRHGIYRDIIYKYKLPMRTKRVRIVLRDVLDDSGNRYETRVRKRGDQIDIRIGSANSTVSGRMVYRIIYHVENGILFFDDHDELYWNVTGTEWPCEIRRATATVYPPAGTPNSEIRTTCFTGAYGSEERDCSSKIGRDKVDFYANNPLGTFNNLSIGLSIPKGIIEKPGFAKWLSWYFVDLWPLLLLLACIVWLAVSWFSRGRDPVRMSIAPRYEPPEGLSPAEAGTLIDEKVDIRDMTSTIVDLAVRGYIKIIELEKKKLLFLKTKDYAIVRLKKADDKLKAHESKMLSGLFEKGSIDEEDAQKVVLLCPECKGKVAIAVSSLKEKFYTELPKIRDSIYNSLVSAKYFPSRPDEVRSKYSGFGVIMIIVAFPLSAVFSNWIFAASLVPAGILTIIVGRFMPRKTRKGSIEALHVAGFEEFVRRVEKDRIERMAADDPTVFERLLPYAMALGVADQWAEAFKGIFKEQPSWFVGGTGQAFYPYMFVHSLGNAVDSVGTAMSARPRSSGAGGGHSSFGGGGFSGGGFGGGGGGAW